LRLGLVLVLILGALLALMLPHLGAAPLERAEIYFLDAARAMVDSGDWVVPRYEGEPFFDKPPLTYWLMGLAFVELGPEPGAARLVPVLAALGVVLATVWLGVLLFDRRTAVFGAIVLGTTLAYLSFARVAMSDMPLSLLTTLAVALGVRAFAPEPPRWIVPALGAVLGLGFATKGPIALLVVGLALLLLGVAHRRRPLPVGPGRALVALLAFAVLGLGWYVVVFWRLGAAPLAHFFVRENLQRFAGDAYDTGEGPWFYVAAYLADGVPWSLFLPLALWRLLRKGGGDPEGRPSARFLAGWIGLVLVPLTLSRGKLDYYLLPLYPAVSLLIGRFLVAVPWRRLDRTWVRGVLLLAAAAVAAAVAHPPRVPGEWLPGPWGRGLLAAVLAASALLALAAALRLSPRAVLAALGGGMAASWLVVVVFFLPAFAAAQPNRAIVADVAREQRYRPDLRLALCEDPARARPGALRSMGQRGVAGAVPAARRTRRGSLVPRHPPLPDGGDVPLPARGRPHPRGSPPRPRARQDRPRRQLQDDRPRGGAEEEARAPQGPSPPVGRAPREAAPASVLVVLPEEELIGAALAAEVPAVLPAAAVGTGPLEADRALLEPGLELALLADLAVHEVAVKCSTHRFFGIRSRLAVRGRAFSSSVAV
jgi:4-amino-4-deoxy-L-arabinose transferase-like glycosyltransferase